MTCAKTGTSFGVRFTIVGSPLESVQRQKQFSPITIYGDNIRKLR